MTTLSITFGFVVGIIAKANSLPTSRGISLRASACYIVWFPDIKFNYSNHYTKSSFAICIWSSCVRLCDLSTMLSPARYCHTTLRSYFSVLLRRYYSAWHVSGFICVHVILRVCRYCTYFSLTLWIVIIYSLLTSFYTRVSLTIPNMKHSRETKSYS